MAPALLSVVKVQGLESLLNRLMASEAGPFMVSGVGTELGLSKVGLRLVQPVAGAVHHSILTPAQAVARLQRQQ